MAVRQFLLSTPDGGSQGRSEGVGLHLNLTEGRPLSPLASVPSLVTEAETHFLGKAGFLKACELGQVAAEDVMVEAEAQMGWFEERWGGPPSHLDGHQHCHVAPGVADALARLLATRESARFGPSKGEKGGAMVRLVRVPEEPNAPCRLCPTCSRVQAWAAGARRAFESAGLVTRPGFVGCSLCGLRYTVEDLVAAIAAQAARLRREWETRDQGRSVEEAQGSRRLEVEVMCHPGRPSMEPGTLPSFFGDFDRSDDREEEVRVLCDPALPFYLLELGIVVCRNESQEGSSKDRTLMWETAGS